MVSAASNARDAHVDGEPFINLDANMDTNVAYHGELAEGMDSAAAPRANAVDSKSNWLAVDLDTDAANHSTFVRRMDSNVAAGDVDLVKREFDVYLAASILTSAVHHDTPARVSNSAAYEGGNANERE